MPVSATTTACRAAAARLANFTKLAGNINIIRQIVYEDPAQTQALQAIVLGRPSPPQNIVDGLTDVHVHQSNLMEQCGVVSLFPLIEACGAELLAAVVYVEGLP